MIYTSVLPNKMRYVAIEYDHAMEIENTELEVIIYDNDNFDTLYESELNLVTFN